MGKLTTEQEKHLKSSFEKKDLNKDGRVTVAEFREAFSYLSPADLDELLKTVNPNDDDEISLDEFLMR